MMIEAETLVDVDSEMPEVSDVLFTAHDRCDVCNAQAYTIAIRSDLPANLLFCLHHRRKSVDKLIEDGWTLVDNDVAIAALTKNRLKEDD